MVKLLLPAVVVAGIGLALGCAHSAPTPAGPSEAALFRSIADFQLPPGAEIIHAKRCYRTKQKLDVYVTVDSDDPEPAKCPPKDAVQLVTLDLLKATREPTDAVAGMRLIFVRDLVKCPNTFTDEYGCFDSTGVIVTVTDEWPAHFRHLLAHSIHAAQWDGSADKYHSACGWWYLVDGTISSACEADGTAL